MTVVVRRLVVVFFFSSRRRHTRLVSDWSSDVCSSDLKIQSGYNLREIIDHIDELRFRSQTEKHELSHLYEAKIKNMGNAGRNGGEYYTPRPLIRALVRVIQPKLDQRIYDGTCGSARVLIE